MELKILLQHLRSRITIVALVTVCFGIGGFLLATYWPDTYTAHLSIYVQKEREETATGDYTYDGYYAQQAAEGYTDTVVGLLESPDLMSQALQTIDIDTSNVRKYVKSLTVEKVAPQIVDLSMRRPIKSEAVLAVSALADATIDHVDGLNTQGRGQYTLSLVEATPLVSQNTLPAVLLLIVGAFFGMGLSVFAVLGEFYLMREDG